MYLIRYSRDCDYHDLLDTGLLHTRRLLNIRFQLVKMKPSLRMRSNVRSHYPILLSTTKILLNAKNQISTFSEQHVWYYCRFVLFSFNLSCSVLWIRHTMRVYYPSGIFRLFGHSGTLKIIYIPYAMIPYTKV